MLTNLLLTVFCLETIHCLETTHSLEAAHLLRLTGRRLYRHPCRVRARIRFVRVNRYAL
jgi:hypothetical protein